MFSYEDEDSHIWIILRLRCFEVVCFWVFNLEQPFYRTASTKCFHILLQILLIVNWCPHQNIPMCLYQLTHCKSRKSWTKGRTENNHCEKYRNFTWFSGVEILRKLCGNCAFPQNFHTRKSDEVTVFFAVNVIEGKIIFWSDLRSPNFNIPEK